MNQRTESSRFPCLPLRISLEGGHQTRIIEIEALVDTGFDGDIIVPETLIGPADTGDFLTWRLADGSRLRLPYHTGVAEIIGLNDIFRYSFPCSAMKPWLVAQ
jgi:predicted aspartyl protease